MNVDHTERPLQPLEATTPAARTQPRARIQGRINITVIPLVLLLALILLPLLLPAPHTGLTIDIGAENGLNEYGESRAGFYLFDVNDPERDTHGAAFRWTKSFSSLRMLDIFAIGSPLLLDLRACSCRPAGVPDATTTLTINTSLPLVLPLGAQQRQYQLLVPQRPSDYGRDLYLEFRSTTFRLPNDDRDLGARLDSVRVSPTQPWGVLGMPPLGAWALYAAAVFGLWMMTKDERRKTKANHNTHLFRPSSFAFHPLITPLLLATVLLATPYLYRPHFFTLPVVAIMSIVAFYSATLVARPLVHRIVLAGAGVWMTWSSQMLGHWMLDDAYISFHYAANMLAGNGLVFNPGERVEGYTNFLWTMLAAVPLAWRSDPTHPMSLLTLVIGLGVVLLTYRWGLAGDGGWGIGDGGHGDTATGKQRGRDETTSTSPSGALPSAFGFLLSLFAPLLLAVNVPFLLYTARGSGMETALFTLLLVMGSYAVQRAQGTLGVLGAGILLALATMTRPDGALGVVAAGLYLLARPWLEAHGYDRRARLSGLRSSVAPLLGFLMLFAPYYLWRYSYYGYPLPNTFYAKVGTGWAQILRGLTYANAFAGSLGWRFLALVVVGGLGATLWRRRSHKQEGFLSPTVAHLTLIVAIYSAYTIVVGGDHFPGFRFFVPIVPMLALLVQRALLALARVSFPRRIALVPALSATALALVYLSFTAMQLPATDIGIAWSDVRGENNVVEKNRELGLWLRDHTPPTTVVATGIAGAVPFYSGLRVIDTLGLNDLHIAHLNVQGMGTGEAGAEKTDVPYVLDQRPDYIPYSTSGTFQGYPRFKQDYAPIEVRGPEGRAMRLYRRTTP